MKVVIYGEYPPTPGPAAEATLEAVRTRLAAGVEVEVVSPRPSAAHHHADLATVRGAAVLARLAAGADLEMTLDPARLAASGGRATPAQALLALAVNGARHSTVHLGALGGPAGRGRVRLVLGRAGAVSVASEADADALERAGVARARLSVRPVVSAGRSNGAGSEAGASARQGAAGGAGAGVAQAPWELSEAPTREQIEAAVRRRAAADRESTAGNSAASTWPLHLLGPFSPPPSGSGKPLFALVKKVVWRLTAWVVLPLAEHINHLQQATIESIDRHAALPDHTGDRQITIS
ncbi:MAG: hypothetical protein QOI86_2686 [Actinomycetota bacterium]|nr:hypothetical protein [Actinomycetota bacterium]